MRGWRDPGLALSHLLPGTRRERLEALIVCGVTWAGIFALLVWLL